jgi:hypothetical protein
MRAHDDRAAFTAEERLRKVAAIFAAGILRLHSRAALPTNPGQDSVQDCLEVPTETVLTVHRG